MLIVQAAEVLSGADGKADDIKKIVFACDAGMGSSAMGATKFRNRIKPLNLGITVTNTSVDNVPADADVVVCQYILQDISVMSAPQARLVAIGNFLQDLCQSRFAHLAGDVVGAGIGGILQFHFLRLIVHEGGSIFRAV